MEDFRSLQLSILLVLHHDASLYARSRLFLSAPGTLYYLLVSPFGTNMACLFSETCRGSSSLRTWGTIWVGSLPFVTCTWRHQNFNSSTKKTLLLEDLGDLFILHIYYMPPSTSNSLVTSASIPYRKCIGVRGLPYL